MPARLSDPFAFYRESLLNSTLSLDPKPETRAVEFDLYRGLATLGAVLLLPALAGFFWLTAVVAWGERRTKGLAYFGLPPEERARFKRRLAFHAGILAPMIRLTARASPFSFEKASFHYRGVTGPKGTCSPESFGSGAGYQPSPADIFVVTQMRSGTTWMQHLVYEVLMRGKGDLVEKGRTLNAVSPWLESVIGVPVEDAPTVGRETPSRVIKTHFPVSLCPYSARSRYVYVARHPVSCFASCVDFLADDLGTAAPSMAALEAWFCSETMWWGSWPSHVEGWWSRSRDERNILFVRYETMLENLSGVVTDVAAFLGVPPLSAAEMQAVSDKIDFDYMARHRNAFEMYPPHVLAADSAYLAKGTAQRHEDVPNAVRERIKDWCRTELEGGGFPLDRFYPDPEPEGGRAMGTPRAPQNHTRPGA